MREGNELILHRGSSRLPRKVNVVSGDAIEITTAHGPARVHVQPADGSGGLLLLGHGAGGGVGAADLQAAASAAVAGGWHVALVEQPYRVAGRRAPAPAGQLDTAWTEVAQHLLSGRFAGSHLVVGGRSSGARVACRTSAALGAVGVLCLAFPLQPPARAGRPVRPSRLAELDAVTVPTLVVQGERDPFGVPLAGPHRDITVLPGDHSLDRDLPAVGAAVGNWLARLTAGLLAS